MLPIRTDQKIAIFGMTGTGKTTLAKELAKKINRKVIVMPYDVAEQWQDVKAKKIVTDFYNFEYHLEPVYRKGNTMVIIDEADVFYPNHLKLEAESIRYKLIHLGRPRNMGVMFISRRPANLHVDARSQTSHFFFFRLILPNDIEWCRTIVGDYAYKFKDLKDYWFYHYDGREIYLHPPLNLKKSSNPLPA